MRRTTTVHRVRHHVISAGAVVLLLCASASNAMGQAHYEQATALLEEGTEDAARQAVRHFKEALAEDSSSALVYLGLARAYRQTLRRRGMEDPVYLDSLVQAGNQAIALHPEMTEAYTLLADVYRAYSNHTMARLTLTDGVSSNPDDPVLLTYLGRNYFDTGNCGLARPQLDRAMELGPVPLTHRYLGWCHFYLRQPERQQEHFSRYVELEPDSDQGMGGARLVLHHAGAL